MIIFQVDAQRRVEIDRIDVHDTAALAELPLLLYPVDPAITQIRYAADQFIRPQGFVNKEFNGLEHAALGIFRRSYFFRCSASTMGETIKTVEYVPTTNPIIRHKAKVLRTSPP